MSKIRVLLSYPWVFTDSPYYNYLKNNPPNGIQLTESNQKKELILDPKKISLLKDLKNNLRNIISKYNLSKPNIHNPPNSNYDIIHCAHHLSLINSPWVMDIEGLFQLYIGSSNPIVDKEVEKILTNKNCKKIIPWTNGLKKELQKKFPKIKNKLEVVYPAVPVQIKELKKKKNKINLLFIGRYFYMKGGLHSLDVMDKLTKKHPNVFGTIISNTPKKIINKYSNNKKLKFYSLMSQKKLKKHYKNSNIFIYPGYTDSFGFCFLEAMSYGLPIITVNGKNRHEIIENNKDGYIVNYLNGINYKNIDGVNQKVINNLYKTTEKLILDKKLREKMSKNAFFKIKYGKFSIKERNKKILKIYREAMK